MAARACASGSDAWTGLLLSPSKAVLPATAAAAAAAVASATSGGGSIPGSANNSPPTTTVFSLPGSGASGSSTRTPTAWPHAHTHQPASSRTTAPPTLHAGQLVDTSRDGRADAVLVDTIGDGRADTILRLSASRDAAELRAGAAAADARAAEAAAEYDRLSVEYGSGVSTSAGSASAGRSRRFISAGGRSREPKAGASCASQYSVEQAAARAGRSSMGSSAGSGGGGIGRGGLGGSLVSDGEFNSELSELRQWLSSTGRASTGAAAAGLDRRPRGSLGAMGAANGLSAATFCPATTPPSALQTSPTVYAS